MLKVEILESEDNRVTGLGGIPRVVRWGRRVNTGNVGGILTAERDQANRLGCVGIPNQAGVLIASENPTP
jgi:hypothetical protein